jgi:hypothetical protein
MVPSGPSGPPGHGTYLRLRQALIRRAWPPVTEGLHLPAISSVKLVLAKAGNGNPVFQMGLQILPYSVISAKAGIQGS